MRYCVVLDSTKRPFFVLCQIESICRQLIKCWSNHALCGKHLGKSVFFFLFWLPSFSFFPRCFRKTLPQGRTNEGFEIQFVYQRNKARNSMVLEHAENLQTQPVCDPRQSIRTA